MAANMTFSSLKTDLQNYSERDDSVFISQLDRLISQGESRIAAEARGLGLMRSVTDDLRIGSQPLLKPARWRETVSIQIGTSTNFRTRVMLYQRPYEFCREFWPDPTQTGQPRYYADWDYHHWLIVPTPQLAYPYEVIYHERPRQLDDEHQTNWTTQYAPQLLLYACLLECQPFLKRDDRIPVFKGEYDRALQQLATEQSRRLIDRTSGMDNHGGG